MLFEFDLHKSAANKKKHGIDFEEAQLLWNDPQLLEIPARTEDGPRYLVIGQLNGKCWSAVITYRGESAGEAKVRLISVRRSKKEEIELYESEKF